MAAHNDLGKWGEQQAIQYLQSKNYTIIEHDWKSTHKDIDIVAMAPHNGTVVFVEVKTRSNRFFTDPIASINYRKRMNLLKAINHYIHYRHLNSNIRFDIITIVGTIGNTPEIEHYEDVRLY